MTLWKESTNVLPADGATVWVRRFPGIEHPKLALFSTSPPDLPTFTVTVNAPDTGHPVTLVIPASQIHSWRPQTGGVPGPGACAPQSGSGTPIGTHTPAYIGQLYHDTAADSYYRSTGPTSADWILISGGSTVQDMHIEWDPATLDLGTLLGFLSDPTFTGSPCLTGITRLAFTGALLNFLDLEGAEDLATLLAPDLTTVTAYLYFYACPSITSISLPSLVTISGTGSVGGLSTVNCSALTTLDLAAWVPLDSLAYVFYGCALSTASVELILRRFVLAGITASSIDLTGGTNAGLASLSQQGQDDAATLDGQLAINP